MGPAVRSSGGRADAKTDSSMPLRGGLSRADGAGGPACGDGRQAGLVAIPEAGAGQNRGAQKPARRDRGGWPGDAQGHSRRRPVAGRSGSQRRGDGGGHRRPRDALGGPVCRGGHHARRQREIDRTGHESHVRRRGPGRCDGQPRRRIAASAAWREAVSGCLPHRRHDRVGGGGERDGQGRAAGNDRDHGAGGCETARHQSAVCLVG